MKNRKFRNSHLKKHLFSEQKWNVFEMKNQGLGEIKPRFSL